MPASEGYLQRRFDTRYAWGVCAVLLLAIGLIYGQTLGHALLVYDDSGYVYDNPHVTAGLTGEGVRWAFADGPYGEWYPLAVLSHMLDCQLFGLSPWGHHLTGVLLHAAASIGLFLVLVRMTGELWPSALVAMLFGIHPQHVESVAWVAERRDVLSGLFFVLTLGAWLGYVRSGRSLARYLLVAALFALGLMAKPMLVTLPPLLLLLDFWPLGRFGSAVDAPDWIHSSERTRVWRLVLEKLPLCALAAGACVMTLRNHSEGGQTLAWSARLGNAAISIATYVVDFFYPADLAAFYPYPMGGPPTWKVVGAIGIVAFVSVAVTIWRRQVPYFFVGWLWYLGMLVPVLGLVTISHHAMADRYMYLPGVGLYIALGWGLTRLAARLPEGRWVLSMCAGLVVAMLVACSARQTSFWRDDETLWRHALTCNPDNGKAEFGLAYVLARQGKFDDAILYFRRAETHPIDIAPFNNLGVVFAQLGRWDEAIDQYQQALAMQPDDPAACVNLGAAFLQQGRFDEAIACFRRAEKHPIDAAPFNNLGVLFARLGRWDEAVDQYQQALAIQPNDMAAHVNLGLALLQRRSLDEAKQHFRLALEIDPAGLEARCGLAHLLLLEDRPDEARIEFEQAVAIHPRSVAAHDGLAQVLLRQAKPDESILHCRAALAIDPKFYRAHINLARALADSGQPEEAAAHYRRALELDPGNRVARQNLDNLLNNVR
jgi:protein O-mannosyl-transferase